MNLALQLSGAGVQVLKDYVTKNHVNLSDFVLRAALEKIENEQDLRIYNEAMDEYKANPVTYSHAEIKERLGL